jgi:hypothetical protein
MALAALPPATDLQADSGRPVAQNRGMARHVREGGARPPVCQYRGAMADTDGRGLPLGWTIQTGVRGLTYLRLPRRQGD